MPNPREAIYDVLKSKLIRKKEEQAKEAAWAAYEEQNERANRAMEQRREKSI